EDLAHDRVGNDKSRSVPFKIKTIGAFNFIPGKKTTASLNFIVWSGKIDAPDMDFVERQSQIFTHLPDCARGDKISSRLLRLAFVSPFPRVTAPRDHWKFSVCKRRIGCFADQLRQRTHLLALAVVLDFSNHLAQNLWSVAYNQAGQFYGTCSTQEEAQHIVR